MHATNTGYSIMYFMLTILVNVYNAEYCSQLVRTFENPHTLFYKMLTTLENAHNSRKCSQLMKMLTTLKNAHNACKMLTTLENAHTSCKMLAALENAHTSCKCSKLLKMLTACTVLMLTTYKTRTTLDIQLKSLTTLDI